jgi:hypothetical protein
MPEDEQGLYLLSAICSIISLLSACLVLLLSAFTGLWKSSSLRLPMYFSLISIAANLDLLMPTSKYSFMCSFQGHLLSFALSCELIFGCLCLHYAYLKVLKAQPFTEIHEITYLGLIIIPSLLASFPGFISEPSQENCWAKNDSPLRRVVESYSFLVLYPLGLTICIALGLSLSSYLSRFSKHIFAEEYEKKVNKVKLVGRYAGMVYSYCLLLYAYALFSVFGMKKQSLEFIAMFCHASQGTFALFLFLTSSKVQSTLRYYKKPSKIAPILPH